MTGGREILSLIGQRQDLDQFRRKNWEGTFEEYLDVRARRSARHAQRLRARVRHDHVVRHRDVRRLPRKTHPLPLLRRSRRQRPRRRVRPRQRAGPAGQRLQERGQGLRHRKTRAAAARAGGQQQEHHRPAAEEGAGALLAARRRGLVHARLGRPGESRPGALVPDERRAAAPDSRPLPRGSSDAAQRRARSQRLSGPDQRRAVPLLPLRLQRTAEALRRRLDARDRRRARQAADPERERPHRHRHVPAEGRKEPGLAPS